MGWRMGWRMGLTGNNCGESLGELLELVRFGEDSAKTGAVVVVAQLIVGVATGDDPFGLGVEAEQLAHRLLAAHSSGDGQIHD